MAKFRLKSKITGEYIEITQEAIETPVEDIMGYYEGKNVETVLSEIGIKIRDGIATPSDIELLKSMLNGLNAEIAELKDGVSGIEGIDTETLKEIVSKYEDGNLGGGGSLEGIDIDILKEMIVKYENGNLGGGGAVSPTIESNFPSKTVVEEGQGITLDIFFQTPNLGDGTLYIVINNAEIDLQPTIKQGDNSIVIKGSYLNKTNNTISVYARDRVGMTSNRLSFTVISGGVSLSTTFDYTVDYVVGQNILFPFNVTTEIAGEIILYRTIDGIELEPMTCENGYNSFYLNDYITGVGSHAVSMYAMVGTYKSKVLNFNVVIASSTQLNLSTSTLNGTQFTYGDAIQISYRISKLGNEIFEVNFYVDDTLMRTTSVSTGSYIWTIPAGTVDVGTKTIRITATGTSGDSAEISIEIEVVKGAFIPVNIVKGGLVCHLDSDGYSNEMTDKAIWKDKTENGHDAELIDFNFATNGWNVTLSELEPSEDGTTTVTKVTEHKGLVCNNGAYVRIPYKPFYNNVINGFTIEMVYTPEHSGNNQARVLEYVDHDAPYVGVYASIDEAFIKSESEHTAGQIDLDYESGEIQLDFVIDREKKLCLIYLDGIVTRYWSLADSGNNRESFAIDQDYIYLNFSALSEEFCGGTNVIRKFLCYERALSHDEVVNNWVANASDIIEMERRHNWCYNTQIPKLQIYGDISNISSSVPAYVRIKYISPDEEKYGASFDLESANSPIYLQGTSSLGYSRKNYRFVLIDNNGQQYFHEMFPGNALPESTYTAKCDYVDSSLTCNVTLCKIANDTLYGPSFTDAQRDNPKRRTATYGHAIELVNIVNNVEESLGAYTLIIDRYAEESMGYKQKEYPNILVLEGESNSDTGASSFHAYTNPESSGSQFPNETEYINEGFRVVYPPTNESAYDFADIKKLVNFVDLASDDDFKDSFESYFHKESVLKYYLFCLCFASVDTLAKNLHFVRYRNLWYILPYDCDSVLGGSNVGFLNISSSCEVGNVYDEQDPTLIVEPNQFNSWNGRLWARMRNTFGADLTSMWTTLRSNGTFNYDNFIKYFDQIWDVLPPTMYNSSQQIKYINYGVTGQVALHGNRKHQIKKFLRERLAYLDSKFGFYSDGGAENYVNIRMNTLGNVSLTVETYYPVYYTVKWATNNIETHRIAKNTKCTFKYFSDVSTDREVLLYLPHALKSIENLDSLKPASIDISKAVRLNKIEVHSDRLFSVNLANNKYLRTIDFNGCVKLGTDTISTMSIIYAKYLKYLDVRGTKLTAINFPNEGGSIVECYLPETITSLEVKNQLLLTDLILQNNTVDLATVDISNCPNISRLSVTSTDKQFDVFKYCRNLKINNSFLSTKEIELSGFTRLQNITLSNIEGLESLGLNDLCEVGGTSSLRYIGVSNCKNLTTLTMNCSSNDYEITLANNALLDLSTANVVEIFSNCIIKGLDTIVLPRTIKNMFFTDDYGSGYSSVVNMWSAQTAAIDSTGVFPEARHMDANSGSIDSYKGIDFFGLQIQNIDLAALVNIPNAKNFNLSPTTVNPNFNKNRDGETYPYLRPSGILDLSNYTESLANFFNGVDLDEFIVICNNPLPQTDLSYCFFNATFSTDSAIEAILSNTTGVTNLDYCFYKTNVADTSILNKVNTAAGCTMNYTFAECPNIKTLINIVIPSNVTEVEGMFNKCPLTSITNMTINVAGSISGLFKGCDQLITIATLRIPNVTDVSSTFDGCTNLTNLTGFSLPDTCTKVDNLFNGCYALSVLSMSFGPNIVSGENWYPPNLTTLNDTEILNSAVKLKDCTTLTDVNNMYIEKGDFNDLFNGCVKLTNLDIILGSEIGSMARMLKNCRKINTLPFTIPSTCTNIDEIFAGTSITDVSGLTFDTRITSATNWYSSSITKANNVTIKNSHVKLNIPTLSECDGLLLYNMNNLDNFLENTAIPRLTGLTIPNTVRSMKSFLKNNGVITRAKLEIPNSVTDISELLSGCASLKDISESTFGSGITTTTDWNYGTNLVNLNNVTLNTNTIKFIGNNTIMYVEDFVIGSNVKNIDELFKNCYKLTTDIYIPVHVTSCISAFENCKGITHVQSNWEQTYTNGITPTSCYAGCTAITHIDDDNVIAYGGDNGLDYIPTVWGGAGFDEIMDYCGVYELKIPNDNYTLTLQGDLVSMCVNSVPNVKARVNWGDGTIDIGVRDGNTHTYATAGTYYLKGNVVNGKSGVPFKDIITKILRHPKIINNSHCSLWQNCSKLVYADVSNFNPSLGIKRLTSIFNGCSALETIIGIETLDTSNVTDMSTAFANCSKLKKLDLSGWNMTNVITLNNMFYGCSKLEEIIGIGSWNMPKSTSLALMFYLCSSLKEIDVTNWNCGNGANGTFQGCSSLEKIIGIEHLINSKWTSCNATFRGCSALKEIKTDYWDLSNVTNFVYMFSECKLITSLDLSAFNFALKPYADFSGMFNSMTELNDLKIPNYFKGTAFAFTFSNCSLLTDLSGITFEDTTPNNDGDNAGNGMNGMFNNCTSLQNIGTIICRGSSRIMFGGCNALEKIEEFQFANSYVNYDNYQMFNGITGRVTLDINFTCTGLGPDEFIGTSTNNTWNKPDFTRETVVKLFNCLSQFSGNKSIGSTTYPLSFKSTVRARLTDEDIAIATAKGWTVV